MTTTPQPTPRAAGEAVKAFREYLAVHPDACTGMGGHAMDDMALDLARIALDFAAEPVTSDDLTKRLIAACRHTTLTWEDRRAVGEAIARLQTAKPAQEDAVDSVRQAVRDYYFALDNRMHGILAADKALKAIEAALGTHWVQGQELAARAAPGAAP